MGGNVVAQKQFEFGHPNFKLGTYVRGKDIAYPHHAKKPEGRVVSASLDCTAFPGQRFKTTSICFQEAGNSPKSAYEYQLEPMRAPSGTRRRRLSLIERMEWEAKRCSDRS